MPVPAADARRRSAPCRAAASAARRSARRCARASSATSGSRRPSRSARTRLRARRGRRGRTPAGSARATAARRRGRRSGRPIDRCPCRTRRWRRRRRRARSRNASWLRLPLRRPTGRRDTARARTPVSTQPRGQRVHLAPRRAVDDARLAAMPREHVVQLPLQRRRAAARGRRGSADRTIRRARAGCAARAAPTMSRRTRAVAVAVKACRLTSAKQRAQRAELPVLRPEVVPPLADAVRLVDGDEADAGSAEQRQEAVAALAGQPLGRDVEQRDSAPRAARPRPTPSASDASALL